MTPTETEKLVIRNTADIVSARSLARQLASTIGFTLADQARLATAVSELTRNIIQYAGEGFCQIFDKSDMHAMQVQVVVEDYGPGIPDIEAALADGFSTSGGLGIGLPGTKRLMDSFSIESKPGLTRVIIMLSRKR